MRRRGIRVFALIAVIVALAVAALGFREIHISIPGTDFDRVGSGPLGISLGLDLKGGTHLMYEADLPDEVQVTFQDDVEESQLRDLLTDLGHTRATIAKRDYAIQDLALEEAAKAELREALQGLTPIETSDFSDGILEVTFQESPDEADLRRVLDDLGYTAATIESRDQNQFSIQELSLAERAQQNLKGNLEDELVLIDSFDVSDGVLEVTFQGSLDEVDLRLVLDGLGYNAATIGTADQKQYTIKGLVLDEETAVDLRGALEEKLAPVDEPGGFVPLIDDPNEEQMKGVLNTIRQRINALGTTEPLIQTLGDDQVVVQLPGVGGSTVDVTFQSIPDMLLEIGFVLDGMGHTEATVSAPVGANFGIRTTEPLDPAELDALREALDGKLSPGVVLKAGDDDREIAVTFPSLPNELTLSDLLASLGFADNTIQQQSDVNSFTIRTDETLIAEERDRLEGLLGERVAKIVDFQVTGGIEEAKRLIGSTAQLAFKERQCLVTLEELRANRLLCTPIEEGGAGRFVDRDIDLTGEDLARAFVGRDPTTREHEVSLVFKGRGTDIFSDLTRRLVGDELRRIAIFRDDTLLTAPVVRGHTPDGRTRITGNFTREEARTLAIQLESGRLPVPLTLIREGTVDALLGADSLRKSLIAGLVGLGLVVLFMVAYYRMAGLVAATSLLVYAVILLAILKLVPVTLTLSGIAGLVLSIGMAVDANILIFERMKEEMRSGRTLASAMEVGFRRAWVAIRDSNVSTIITCAILFLFGTRLGGGTPVVTGLAVTLLIGVLVSMFTAYMVSRNMLQILALTPMGKKMALFTPEAKRQPLSVAGGGK